MGMLRGGMNASGSDIRGWQRLQNIRSPKSQPAGSFGMNSTTLTEGVVMSYHGVAGRVFVTCLVVLLTRPHDSQRQRPHISLGWSRNAETKQHPDSYHDSIQRLVSPRLNDCDLPQIAWGF